MSVNRANYAVLFVDDEPNNQVAFRYAMDGEFNVVTASTADEALQLLHDRRIVVLVADQRMPQMSGAELCARAKAIRPDVVRMIATAYADLQEAVEAINRGHVVRYIAKPWRNDELAQILRTAIDFAHMQRTMQEMELHLLRSSQGRAVVAIEDELAHEISGPLSIARSTLDRSVQIIEGLLQENEKVPRESLYAELARLRAEQQIILHAIDHADAVTQRVRDRERGRPAEETTCNAALALETTIAIVRRHVESVASLEVRVEGEPWVAMDSSALGQVVLNLITNAMQALEAGDRRRGSIRVHLLVENAEAVLRVGDDGPGIPPSLLPRIFEPYVTGRADGSGVGLALVRDIVRRSGGRVSVESTDAGTRFEIRIPRAAPRA